MSKTNKKIALPRQVTTKLYVVYGTGRYNQGKCEITTHEFHNREGEDSFSGICLAETEITIDIANTELNLDDIKKSVLKTLRQRKDSILARHHMELREIDEEINNMLAIEYQPESEAVQS